MMMNQPRMTDRDYMQLLLNEHKHAANCLTKFALECASDQLRQQCETTLQETLRHHKLIWNAMNQRQWYQPRMASPVEISQAQNQFGHLTSGQMPQNYGQMPQTFGQPQTQSYGQTQSFGQSPQNYGPMTQNYV